MIELEENCRIIYLSTDDTNEETEAQSLAQMMIIAQLLTPDNLTPKGGHTLTPILILQIGKQRLEVAWLRFREACQVSVPAKCSFHSTFSLKMPGDTKSQLLELKFNEICVSHPPWRGPLTPIKHKGVE